MIQGVAMMVARKLGIPFYVTKFSVIPHSYTTICEYPFPNHEVSISDKSSEELFLLATDVFEKWNAKNLVAPAYVSALTFIDIIKRLPFHIIELIRSIKKVVSGNKNKFVHHSIIFLIKQYLRKKLNLIFRKNNLLISDLPQQPFFFYGFHMQPESTIDVWAPFYSNQFEVIKAIARSMPVSHVLCVKIHVSDADNYSNSEIKKLKSIPGVLVVNPKVSSRKFIENASLIFSIQGTIGLEGCLLGQQVIMFGDSPVNRFSTATKVLDIDDLPNLINSKLFISKPQVAQIVDDFAKFLTNYVPASYDDWATVLKKDLTIQEIENYVELYRKLFEINSVNIN
jgi:hypothetical protein